MDNKFSSILKRSLRVMSNYFLSFVLFCIFGAPVMYLGGESTPAFIPWLSFVAFLVLFFSVYTDMQKNGYKEKRPQYNINPPMHKGILYGLIGAIPIWAIQTVIIAVSVPPDYEAFRRRIFQLFSGPLYWLAKIMGNGIPAYFIALLSIVAIAFLGYWAGHHDFFFTNWVHNQFGVKKSGKDKP